MIHDPMISEMNNEPRRKSIETNRKKCYQVRCKLGKGN